MRGYIRILVLERVPGRDADAITTNVMVTNGLAGCPVIHWIGNAAIDVDALARRRRSAS